MADEVMVQPVTLSILEQRVLGVLIEKQKTTPDVYPMTPNGIVTGCNQKSNRDPVMSLNDEQVLTTLEKLRERGLVMQVQSGRVDKWRHLIYETWNVEKTEIAILAELFLRGPQSEGELRTRVSRMDPIESLEVLRDWLHKLAARKFVIYLGPEGRRGTTITHGFQDEAALEAQRSRHGTSLHIQSTEPGVLPFPSTNTSEIAELRKQLDELRLQVNSLAEAIGALKQQPQDIPPAH
jgi:uncharacterized protein YceH (UPF0502 family)